MKYLIVLICVFNSIASFADDGAGSAADDSSQCYNYTLPPDLDLDSQWLDPCVQIKVLKYYPKHGIYRINKEDDPTIAKIYATPEEIVKSIPHLNLNVIKDNPDCLVGKELTTENLLILLTTGEAEALKLK
jgi:hypothetical protein